MPNALNRLVWPVFLAVGVAGSILAGTARIRLESANRTVALIVDYGQVRRLAAVGGLSTVETLERLARAGATHAAITEQTLEAALESGEIASAPLSRDQTASYPPPTATVVGPAETIQRAHRSLVERLGKRVATFTVTTVRGARLDLRGLELTDVASIGIGYPLGALHEISRAGLMFVPRPFAEGNQWQRATSAALNLAYERNARLLIFAGTEVPGYPDYVAAAADEFRARGLLFGLVEFGKQYGDLALAARLPENLIRVHSINETEMLGMTRRRAIERFTLAVRERNVRACYVRLFEPAGPEPVREAETYLRDLAGQLRGCGYRLGDPSPFRDLALAPILRWMAMLGPLGALGLFLCNLVAYRPQWAIAVVAAGAVITFLGAILSLTATAKLCALLGALALPTLAVGRRLPTVSSSFSCWPALLRGLLSFAAFSGMTLLAGIFIVGCLADTRFLIKIDQYSGVKLSHLIPLAAVLVLQLGFELGSEGSAQVEPAQNTLFRGWRRAASAVVRYWHAALILLCIAAVTLMMVRTGNETGVGVPSLELQFRGLMDRVFGVRPRTKEVLIGHPLLVLALARAMRGKRRGLWALLTGGTVGQVSMVNSFSHLHTPVVVSVTRTLHGLWVGALLGTLLYLIVELIEQRLRIALCESATLNNRQS